MRGVVLDEVDLGQIRFINAERLSQWFLHIVQLSQVARAIHDVRNLHAIRYGECSLPEQVRLRVAADSNMSNVFPGDAADFQNFGYRLRRESCPVLDAAESFFFYCSHEVAVMYENG